MSSALVPIAEVLKVGTYSKMGVRSASGNGILRGRFKSMERNGLQSR